MGSGLSLLKVSSYFYGVFRLYFFVVLSTLFNKGGAIDLMAPESLRSLKVRVNRINVKSAFSLYEKSVGY